FTRQVIGYDRAYRHTQHDVFRSFAIAIRAASVFSPPGPKNRRTAIIDQGIEIVIGQCINPATVTPIPSIRSASGNEFLTTKAGNTIAAISRKNLYFYLIDEFHECPKAIILIAGGEIYSSKNYNQS